MAQTGEVFAAETVRRHKDGVGFQSPLCASRVSGTGSGNTGYVIYRDITRRSGFRMSSGDTTKFNWNWLTQTESQRSGSCPLDRTRAQPASTGIITNCRLCLRMLTGDPLNLEGAGKPSGAPCDGNRASDVIARLRALFNKQDRI